MPAEPPPLTLAAAGPAVVAARAVRRRDEP
jgi:hypothetical protein